MYNDFKIVEVILSNEEYEFLKDSASKINIQPELFMRYVVVAAMYSKDGCHSYKEEDPQ